MINSESFTNENHREHNEKWSYTPDHLPRTLIIGDSGSGKIALLDLINEQDNCDFIDKIYLYARDLNKPKYQLLIEKHKNVRIRHFNNPNAFIECSNMIDDVYENIDDYNPSRKRERKKLIVFDDMIADIVTRFQAIIKELFIR